MNRSASEVSSLKLTCNGNDKALGHPRIFLAIQPSIGEVVCPYCSQRFIFKERKKQIYPDVSKL